MQFTKKLGAMLLLYDSPPESDKWDCFIKWADRSILTDQTVLYEQFMKLGDYNTGKLLPSNDLWWSCITKKPVSGDVGLTKTICGNVFSTKVCSIITLIH